MAARKEALNPFYPLLVVLGIAFAVTACAYCVLTLRGMRGLDSSATIEPASLLGFLNQYGGMTLTVSDPDVVVTAKKVA